MGTRGRALRQTPAVGCPTSVHERSRTPGLPKAADPGHPAILFDMARTTLTAGLVPLALLGACAGPLNHESSIGEPGDPTKGVELRTINPDAPRQYSDTGLYDGSPWSRQQQSLTGIDRDNWAQQDFLVPIDGTSHQPTYSVHQDFAHELPRERGLYPDATTALDLRGEETGELQALEALAAPFYCGLDMVLWIPRAILVPPGSTLQSPGAFHERTPRLNETWVLAVPPSQPPPSDVVPEPGPKPAPSEEEPYPEPVNYDEKPAQPPTPAPTPEPAPTPSAPKP